MYSSSFLSSLVRSSPKNLRKLGQILLGRARLQRWDLAHGLEELDEIGAAFERQVMREGPGLGIVGRGQCRLEQERLGLGHQRVAGRP